MSAFAPMAAQRGLPRPPIYVGIDFGTTYSGIGYALDRQSNPRIVERWPGLPEADGPRPKVPTRLYFPTTESKDVRFGYQISDNAPESQVAEFFKLGFLLDTIYAADRHLEKGFIGRSHFHLTELYLAKLWEQLDDLLWRDGSRLDKYNVYATIGIPATWANTHTGNELRVACKHSFRLATSAEIEISHIAYAFEALCAYERLRMIPEYCPPRDAQQMLVIDLGGGTIESAPWNTQSLRDDSEICELRGRKDLMSKRLGAIDLEKRIQEATFVQVGLVNTRQRQLLYRSFFHDVMINYLPLDLVDPDQVSAVHTSPSPDFPFGFSDKDLAGRQGKSRNLIISGTNFEPIFHDICEKIINNMVDCVEDITACQVIYVVGGFSKIPYIRRYLEKNLPFHHRLCQSIEIIFTDPMTNAWTVTLEGIILMSSRIEYDADYPTRSVGPTLGQSYGMAYRGTTLTYPEPGDLAFESGHTKLEWLYQAGDPMNLCITKTVTLKIPKHFMKKAPGEIELLIVVPITPTVGFPTEYDLGLVDQICNFRFRFYGEHHTRFEKITQKNGTYWKVTYKVQFQGIQGYLHCRLIQKHHKTGQVYRSEWQQIGR